MSSGFLSALLLRITTKESCSRSIVVNPLTLVSILSRNQQLYIVYSHSPIRGSSAASALFFIKLFYNVVSNVRHCAGSTYFNRFEIEIRHSLKKSSACANGHGSYM